MNKRKYLILFSVLLLGLGFSVYQYFQALETNSVSAVTVGTPDPGHAWSQMECSADSLCVDTVNNRLGIGTNTPGEKLTVSGNLSITGIMTGGTVPWARLGSFPSACSSGQYVTGVGSTLTCATPASGGITGSGTASYIPRWSSGSALTNSIIYDNGTNVGIGNTSPGQKLDVTGYVKGSSGLCIGSDCRTDWGVSPYLAFYKGTAGVAMTGQDICATHPPFDHCIDSWIAKGNPYYGAQQGYGCAYYGWGLGTGIVLEALCANIPQL